jgi:hypothetical protein
MSVYIQTILGFLIFSWLSGRLLNFWMARSNGAVSPEEKDSPECSSISKSSWLNQDVVYQPFKKEFLFPDASLPDHWKWFFRDKYAFYLQIVNQKNGRFILSLDYFNLLLNSIIPWLFLIVMLLYSESGNKTWPNLTLLIYMGNVLIGLVIALSLKPVAKSSMSVEFVNGVTPLVVWSPFLRSAKSLSDVFAKVYGLFRSAD